MNTKAVVAASTTIAGAAAIIGAERPRGYYHNFIISSFQGSLPPVSRQQHLNARRTRYRPRFCVSLVFLVRLLAGRLFLLAPTDSLVSCWEHVQVAPTSSELFKQLERFIYTRAHAYLTKFGFLLRPFWSLFNLLVDLNTCILWEYFTFVCRITHITYDSLYYIYNRYVRLHITMLFSWIKQQYN